MFKKIMAKILDANTEAEMQAATSLIDSAFQHGKIMLGGKEVHGKLTWADHELLWKMVAALNPNHHVAYEDCGW